MGSSSTKFLLLSDEKIWKNGHPKNLILPEDYMRSCRASKKWIPINSDLRKKLFIRNYHNDTRPNS